MDQELAREMINATLAAVDFCLLIVLCMHIYFQRRADPRWYKLVRNQAAVALVVYFGGMLIVRLWAFFLLNFGLNVAVELEQRIPIGLIGTGIATVGAICCIRVFSPITWGYYGWTTSLALAVSAAVAAYVF